MNCWLSSCFIISIILLIVGIVTLSIIWPHVEPMKIQPATCILNLSKAANNLTCSTLIQQYVNGTRYKACNETKLDMILECQRGLEGFGSMCPYRYTNTRNCIDVSENAQEESLFRLECYVNQNLMKVDVTLGDGQRKEQLELWTADDTKSPLTNLDPWECYYYSPKPSRVYWNKAYAETYAPGQLDGLGLGMGIIFGWVPFGISICSLLVLVPLMIKQFKKTPNNGSEAQREVLTK